jgi:hypothetical protein
MPDRSGACGNRLPPSLPAISGRRPTADGDPRAPGRSHMATQMSALGSSSSSIARNHPPYPRQGWRPGCIFGDRTNKIAHSQPMPSARLAPNLLLFDLSNRGRLEESPPLAAALIAATTSPGSASLSRYPEAPLSRAA